jgi:nucleotide-binding universal stress UspA family protein
MSVSMPSPNVVLPLDGSEFAARAIPAAATVARSARTGITLVGVATNDSEASSLSQHLHDAKMLLSAGTDVTEELIVDADPVAQLLKIADDPRRVLFLASHDRMPPSAAILRSVGSRVLARARRPLFVVGRGAAEQTGGRDVVVALDGRHDPEPLLGVAVAWASRFDAPLRLVTVYEPVPADLRDPERYTRGRGPVTDPDLYLERMRAIVEERAPRGVEVASIPDPVSVAAGLSDHLAQRPALILIAGAQHHHSVFAPGVIRVLLRTLAVPVLLVPVPAAPGTAMLERAATDVESTDAR